MMGSLTFLNSPPSIAQNKFLRMTSGNPDQFSTRSRRRIGGYCHGGGGDNAMLSGKISSSVLKTTTMKNNPSADEIIVKNLEPKQDIVGNNGLGIENFLRGKNFFVTGATGFLAKVFIEKILRTVPDVGKIFVLIKAKNEQTAMERLKNEIINAELFKFLQQAYGKSSYQDFMLKKLIPVVGNVRENNLGLQQDLAQLIANQIDIVVNFAANTTFDERYDIAIDTNTMGPCRLMGFAKNCKKLKLFMHVSTAYVNGKGEGIIMEKPFCMGDRNTNTVTRENLSPETTALSKLDIEKEIELALKSKEYFSANKMKVLGLERARKYGWQDTYGFTKAMGEMMINNMRGNIPVVIIRPAVVESTFKDPFPGWIQGNRMIDPIALNYGKGRFTGIFADPDVIFDVVPVDMVVNAMLAAMARHGNEILLQKAEIKVYQIASSVANPITYKYLVKLFEEHFDSSPILDSKRRPIRVPSMKFFDSMEEFLAHIHEEAFQRGGSSSSSSSNEKLETISRKLVDLAKHIANIYQPYTFFGGRFDNSNTKKLMESMSEEEKRKFGFDVGIIDWKDYITNVHLPGLRKHVINGR